MLADLKARGAIGFLTDGAGISINSLELTQELFKNPSLTADNHAIVNLWVKKKRNCCVKRFI